LLFVLLPDDGCFAEPVAVPLDFLAAGAFAAVSLCATAPTDKKQTQASAQTAAGQAITVFPRRTASNAKPTGFPEMLIPAPRTTKAGIAHHPV
jgi:hypothetical protein